MIHTEYIPSQPYILVEKWHSKDTALCCENCGRTILNMARVKGLNNGVYYVIGQDCAASIAKDMKKDATKKMQLVITF